MAALWLSLATNSPSLYQEATNYYGSFQLGNQDAIFNWDSSTPGLAVLFAQISKSYPALAGSTSQWQSQAERYFDRIISGQSPGHLTKGTKHTLNLNRVCLVYMLDFVPGGLLYYSESSDASLNPALNAAMLMYRYSALASTPDKQLSYTVNSIFFLLAPLIPQLISLVFT
jgi:endoglucanase